jgi:heterodisulfide reductase subunit A
MTSALSLAGQGFRVHLVEKKDRLGGLASEFFYTIDNLDVRSWLDETIEKVENNRLITVHKGVEVDNTKGFVGNFNTTLTDGFSFEHGVIIMASGGSFYKPAEYTYGKDSRVITQRELEAKISDGSCKKAGTYVMIQCVGSREEPENYCSRICCRDAVKNAIKIKESNPESAVFVLYRDLRTYGFKEIYYRRARDLGVIFLRYNEDRKPELINPGENSALIIKAFDYTLNQDVEIVTDYVVLSTGLRPGKDNQELSRKYKLTLNPDGFFLEAHVKLRPLDFASEGMFLCGLSHGPKNIDECINQSLAAAGRAGTVLSNDSIAVSGMVAKHNEVDCVSCLSCFRVCPFGSPYIDEDGRVKHNEVKCVGCGICASVCPAKAFQVNSFRDEQIFSMIDAFTDHMPLLFEKKEALLSA